MELLTAAQMRAIEVAAIESGEVTGLDLMERAGRGVVEAIFEKWPDLAASPGKATVLCGPGNNGGDGFVVARLLKEQGWDVKVYLFGVEAELPADAAENCRRWRELGDVGKLSDLDPLSLIQNDLNLTIDALFGTGLSRALPDEIALLARKRAENNLAPHGAFLIAVDFASGIDSDSGRILGRDAFRADLTVTFHAEKIGHRCDEGPDCCGVVCVADIGISERHHLSGLLASAGLKTRRGLGKYVCSIGEVEGEPQTKLGPARAHKYVFGHVLVLSGGIGKGGAARLAARAALRIGAGVVTVAPPPDAMIENAAQLNGIMLCPVDTALSLASVLEDARISTVVLGPGMGTEARTRQMVAVALQSDQRSVVLDADALSSFVDVPEDLFCLTTGKQVVLTPHMGEFARLFPDIHARLMPPQLAGPAYSKVDAGREASARAGCSVLIKGPDTVIASPTGEASIVSAHQDRACPWLATAGAGDVLAGMIAGLLARGYNPKSAAESAAWLHQEAARSFGPGLIAEDLPEEIPKVFRALSL